ncbi:glycosyltransferase family 9 protein [Adhaeribacter soli]|uniref:Glycosyltransferase family 9 protein n=1 Tax=Adhaeribacter soli TaxID=2607655 RepID=A0A5N1IXM3_9BACT|nr:glycosyltransferase family 9 protein [Adhaeribacter soli]KAA9332803.1 glycosyltransferase family 9 protein [Adhaeribacter soli]
MSKTLLQDEKPDFWMASMRCGDFEAAWKTSDAVLKSRAGTPCFHLPRHEQYIWNGTPLEGKRVLVRCYHGLGDTIQFIRYAPLLKNIATEVIVWAQPPLLPLLKTIPEIDQLLPLHDGTPEASYDVDVEIMELPHIFRTTLATIPAQTPYLHVEPHQLSEDDKKLHVGLVWKAGDWDVRRSIPFSQIKPLADISGISLHILQGDAPQAGWQEGFGFYHGDLSLEEYARRIMGLDLMISVDSMPAHLAGALGVHVWNLLHANADWRWLENCTDCPWYPTMRLFRQQEAGEWKPVISAVKTELELLCKQKRVGI